MATEILFYDPIFDFTASEFITRMNEHRDDDVEIRLSSPGGSVQAGWGMIAKMKEHKGKLTIKVDGAASSMAAYLLLFASDVHALDVSRFMFHRASMGERLTDEQKKFVADINADIKAKMKSKIDEAKFESVAGISIDKMFDESEPLTDVWLTAKQAKEIGLVKNITTLDTAANAEHYHSIAAMAAKASNNPGIKSENTNNSTTKKANKMSENITLAQLKRDHPEAYQAAFKEGIAEERDRVNALIVFNEIDAKAVAEKVKSGEKPNHTFFAEMQVKMLQGKVVKGLEGDSPEETPSATPENKTDAENKKEADKKEEAEASDPFKSARELLGLKSKTEPVATASSDPHKD